MNKNIDIVAVLVLQSWRLAVATIVVLALLFVMNEPTITRAVSATDTFTIQQQITDEISFLVTASDIIMVGSIQGVTGGHATGTTYAVVRSNSNSGFTLDIDFFNSPAMLGSSTLSTAIRNYGSTTEPTYGFMSSSSAQFAYSVSASTTSDLDQSFKHDGSVCNAGASFTVNTCWMGPSTTDMRIIDRATPAGSGATTTITFRVTVPNNPVPSVDEDYYVATATLTATNQ